MQSEVPVHLVKPGFCTAGACESTDRAVQCNRMWQLEGTCTSGSPIEAQYHVHLGKILEQFTRRTVNAVVPTWLVHRKPELMVPAQGSISYVNLGLETGAVYCKRTCSVMNASSGFLTIGVRVPAFAIPHQLSPIALEGEMPLLVCS